MYCKLREVTVHALSSKKIFHIALLYTGKDLNVPVIKEMLRKYIKIKSKENIVNVSYCLIQSNS